MLVSRPSVLLSCIELSHDDANLSLCPTVDRYVRYTLDVSAAEFASSRLGLAHRILNKFVMRVYLKGGCKLKIGVLFSRNEATLQDFCLSVTTLVLSKFSAY